MNFVVVNLTNHNNKRKNKNDYVNDNKNINSNFKNFV